MMVCQSALLNGHLLLVYLLGKYKGRSLFRFIVTATLK